ncbi:hypothetical protein MedDCM-OCT-S14-C1-cds42 [uncultured Mediterranean phage MEDS2 group]|nr:hypothetical protein MedDCM-OCT-S14-C1-cds42 [uncultured Mediterranean phage MEDS2 group]
MILCNRSKIICRPDLGGGMSYRIRKGLMERYRMVVNNDNPFKIALENGDIHSDSGSTTFFSCCKCKIFSSRYLKDSIG